MSTGSVLATRVVVDLSPGDRPEVDCEEHPTLAGTIMLSLRFGRADVTIIADDRADLEAVLADVLEAVRAVELRPVTQLGATL